MAVDPPVPPSDAASLVILRGAGPNTEVLMGKRRETARFMPGVYVFPGGAVERQDDTIAEALGLTHRLFATAQRETWEETNILIGNPEDTARKLDPDTNIPYLNALRSAGIRPRPDALTYVARAVTPAESPIRFDTRFFLYNGSNLIGEPYAVGELPEVAWVPVTTALQSGKVRGVSKFVLSEALSLVEQPARLSDPDRAVRLYTYIDGVNIVRREGQADGLG